MQSACSYGEFRRSLWETVGVRVGHLGSSSGIPRRSIGSGVRAPREISDEDDGNGPHNKIVVVISETWKKRKKSVKKPRVSRNSRVRRFVGHVSK